MKNLCFPLKKKLHPHDILFFFINEHYSKFTFNNTDLELVLILQLIKGDKDN